MQSRYGSVRTGRHFGFDAMRQAAIFALLIGFGFLALTACSQDPEAKRVKHFARGQQYLSQGKADEAIIEFRNAIQAAPQYVEAHNALGRAYRQKGWIFDARSAFERAIEIRPDFVNAHLDLASIGLELGAAQIAETATDAALSTREWSSLVETSCLRL